MSEKQLSEVFWKTQTPRAQTVGAVSTEPALDVLALNDALTALAAFDPLLERVVECRFFAGLSVEDTALALGRSTRSVERDWARARAYLFDALSRERWGA